MSTYTLLDKHSTKQTFVQVTCGHNFTRMLVLFTEKLTRADLLSTGTDNVAPQWGSADRTKTAFGVEHLLGAAEPGSTLPSLTPWKLTTNWL